MTHPMVLSARRDLERCEDWDEVAKVSGMSRSWLNQFGRGDINNPTINSLQSIVDAVGIITRETPKRRRIAA